MVCFASLEELSGDLHFKSNTSLQALKPSMPLPLPHACTGFLAAYMPVCTARFDSAVPRALQALKTLFYVPRFRGHTILQPLKAKYGRVLLYAWPKSSHGGVVANNLMSSICRLAGITNIGIKVKLPG